jgi:hypothetical protein
MFLSSSSGMFQICSATVGFLNCITKHKKWCVKAIHSYNNMNYIVFDQSLSLWPNK